MALQQHMNFLITGAARGIGRGLTRSLLALGHRVFLVDSNATELTHTISAAKGWAPMASSAFAGTVADLANREQLKRAVDEAAQFFDGRLDVLVNNACTTPHLWANGGKMEDIHDDCAIEAQWDRTLAVGLTAPFLLARLCAPLLCAGGENRCIVNIASTRAMQAEPDHEAYTAAKAGLLGLTRSLAISLGERYGIRVNSISPGWIHVLDENAEADGRCARWEDGLTDADHKWHPTGRVGKVEDVVRAVLFVAESHFVTGEEVVVDGGVSKKMVYPDE